MVHQGHKLQILTIITRSCSKYANKSKYQTFSTNFKRILTSTIDILLLKEGTRLGWPKKWKVFSVSLLYQYYNGQCSLSEIHDVSGDGSAPSISQAPQTTDNAHQNTGKINWPLSQTFRESLTFCIIWQHSLPSWLAFNSLCTILNSRSLFLLPL
jgi:hypothetical protein